MISDALKGKRYLIVLDNLREDCISPFMFRIRNAFPDEMNGSRVVVTCNDKKDVDLFGQEIEVHELGMLCLEEKWKLFLRTWDFNAKTAETTAGTSLSSGRIEEIVRKQMHLPSEIVNLGDLLSEENRKSSAFSNIMLDHPNSYQVDGPEKPLLKIVSSFNLPESPLKLFFLDCSLFPKGFEIPKSRLIGLWLAEGWLQPKDKWPDLAVERSKTMLYFQDLSHLGMILGRGYHWEDLDFVEKRIRLESHVWDFAALKAMQYNLISHNIDNEGPPDSRSSSSNARGLALHSSGIYDHIFHDQKVSLPNLRRLLCFPQLTVIGEQDPMETLEQLHFLGVLKLRCGSFLGKKMVCFAGGFPMLIFLELSLLDELEEWTVEKGAMRKLKHLVICLYSRLKELPQGLLHLQFIERLEVAGMPDTFNARLKYNE
ncbi:hypothetical protein MRB53_022975 [Persea americana]|uniref:Uncharacterized protein n=1 Tax=Persea americana TaxID=3435 RepID=A0ACC2L832_PERAE|nr:hypothetical protein MRB53_022975 [Persea americana]